MQKEKKKSTKNWEINKIFCEEKLCIHWKRECQIYTKMVIIRRNKINEDKEKDKEWY